MVGLFKNGSQEKYSKNCLVFDRIQVRPQESRKSRLLIRGCLLAGVGNPQGCLYIGGVDRWRALFHMTDMFAFENGDPTPGEGGSGQVRIPAHGEEYGELFAPKGDPPSLSWVCEPTSGSQANTDW